MDVAASSANLRLSNQLKIRANVVTLRAMAEVEIVYLRSNRRWVVTILPHGTASR
jgi:hypothetical protein